MTRRPRHPMPDDVRSALDERALMQAYLDRPAYQRNDYLGWIDQARRPATRLTRLQQMLDELDQGGVYMKMDHPPSSKTDPPGRRPSS